MRIPFLDLTYQTEVVLKDFLRRVQELAHCNQFIGGDSVEKFERSFAQYCGTKHCVALNSGTDGLRLALLAAGIRSRDEVITTPFSFVATSEAINQVGKLILADIDSETFTLSPAAVQEKINERTKVLLPVHTFGLPAPMMELQVLSERNGLKLIEDACQAHGSAIFNQRVGSFGELASFSFYPTKNLGAFGDAGAVTCNNEATAERIRRLRNHGQVAPYQHEEEGYNSRMDSLQSALLDLKLRFLGEWNDWRRRLAKVYRQELADVGEVQFQKELPNYRHCYHLLGALVEERPKLVQCLVGLGIETQVIYPTPIHLLEAYRHLNHRRGDFPNAEKVCQKVLCFPLYPGMSEGQAVEVARVVRHFYGG